MLFYLVKKIGKFVLFIFMLLTAVRMLLYGYNFYTWSEKIKDSYTHDIKILIIGFISCTFVITIFYKIDKMSSED